MELRSRVSRDSEAGMAERYWALALSAGGRDQLSLGVTLHLPIGAA